MSTFTSQALTLHSNCMFDSATPFLSQLPLEILHAILRYLSIPELLRIRRVSRYLNQVSHSREVWSDAYRNAKFVRPPGPCLSQSASDLEKMLVPSFRVDQNLQHGSHNGERRTHKLSEVRYTGKALCVSLVFGRFMLAAFSDQVRCYDLNLDGTSGASVIYRPTNGTLKSCHCVSAIDIEGRPFTCVVLNETTPTTRQISIYSLNLRGQSEIAMDLLYQFEHNAFDIEAVDLGPRVIAVQGRVGGDVDADWRLVALDVHTRTQYLLPSVNHVTSEVAEVLERGALKVLPRSISTSTHLLLARSFYSEPTGWSTYLQAFALPPPQIDCISATLNASHHGLIPGINVAVNGTTLLHDTVFDASTQELLIAIRVHLFEAPCPLSPISKHGVLRLSASHACNDHEIGAVTFQLAGSLSRPQTPIVHPSSNGTGRAFYTLKSGCYWILAALEYDLHARAAKTRVYPSVLRFPAARPILDYDPYSGRICLMSTVARDTVIEILDLAA